MNFYRWLLVGALVVVGAGIAKADGGGVGDPTVKITVPADAPTCGDPNTVCFSSNSEPVVVMGGTALPFDITTYFIYTCDYTGSGCTDSSLAPLDTLYLAIDPTILGDIYTCSIVTTYLEEAFNECSMGGGIYKNPSDGSYDYLFELQCASSTPTLTLPACTGMLANEVGAAEVAPEPSDLILLGIGVLLIGLFDFRRRKFFESRHVTRCKLTPSST